MQLKNDAFTIKNALLFGIGREHLRCGIKSTTWNERIWHIGLGLAGLLPVISQIIGLIELGTHCYLKCEIPQIPFSRPFPLKKRHYTLLNITQEHPTTITARINTAKPKTIIPLNYQVSLYKKLDSDPSLFWPSDSKLLFDTLLLTEEARNEVQLKLVESLKNSKLKMLDKKTCVLSTPTSPQLRTYALPLSCVYFQGLILLYPKKIIGEGGERRIKLVYNLSHGTFLVKKRLVGFFEKTLIQHMNANRKSAQNPSCIFRSSGADKEQVLEPLRDGTLDSIIGKEPLNRIYDRYLLILELVKELATLHKLKLSNVTINNRSLPPYGAFHSDIKTPNVLVYREGSTLKLELSDFGGGAASPWTYTISVGTTPPELIALYKELDASRIDGDIDINKLIDGNLKYAQAADSWKIALLILSLITSRTETLKVKLPEKDVFVTVAPLNFLQKYINLSPTVNYDDPLSTWKEEEDMLNLTQDEIDRDLMIHEFRLLNECSTDLEKKIITMVFKVIYNTLKIKPEERISPNEMLTILY